MASYTKRAVHGAGMIFIMSMLAAVISYFIRIILARQLSPYEYGLFYSVFTLVMFLLFFRDLGMGTALVKFIPEFQIKKKYNQIKSAIISVIGWQLLTSILMALILLLLSNTLAINYFKDPNAANILRLLVLYIIGSAFYRLFKSVFHGFQKMKIFSTLEFLKNGTALLLLLLFLKLGFGVFAPTLMYASLCFVLILILIIPFLKTFPLNKHKTTNFWPVSKKLFMFAVPVFLTTVGGKFISYIDTLILTYFGTLEQVGIYNVILPSALIFLYFGNSVSAAIFPMVSELWAKKDKKRVSEGLRILNQYAFAVVTPLALTIIVFANLFISFFFGKEYITGAFALQILMVGMLFYVVASINHSIISALGKPKSVTKIILFAALINLIANLLLIPKFNIAGAALATSLSYFIALVLSTYKLTNFAKIKFPIGIWIKLFFSSILFVTIVYIVKQIISFNPWIELIISAFLGGVIYLLAIYFFGIIKIKEIKAIFKLTIKKS